tara:strand:+ start:184 stop:774 length:591 start_codon:yes stop_codon:yes gene_type:complete
MKKRLQTRQDRILTLANAISISRIVLTIPLILTLEKISLGYSDKLWQAFAIIILIILSDYLDGYVARKAKEITHFGKLIDPVADKICMMVVAIYLIIIYKLPFLIFFIMLALRDTFLVIIGIYLIFFQEEMFESNLSGKWFIFICSIMMFLFVFKDALFIKESILWSMYIVSVILFFISSFNYFKRYMNYFKVLSK